jgi:hypothetical protein
MYHADTGGDRPALETVVTLAVVIQLPVVDPQIVIGGNDLLEAGISFGGAAGAGEVELRLARNYRRLKDQRRGNSVIIRLV